MAWFNLFLNAQTLILPLVSSIISCEFHMPFLLVCIPWANVTLILFIETYVYLIKVLFVFNILLINLIFN
jgi:hypothetical protein